jgi:hypothetical protein
MRLQNVSVRIYIPDSVIVNVQRGGYRILRLESSDTQESIWNESPYSLHSFIMESRGLRALK